MKILLINKFYYMAGGVERYVFEWEKILRARGHDVMIFSMHHPMNRPCPQERFFADHVSFRSDLPSRERLRAAVSSLWSVQARIKLNRLLESEPLPDVAHIHSFVYQLTPSVLLPLWERGVPLIQTCHEYAHVCVNQRLFDQRTNRICNACFERGRLAPLWKRCLKGSFAASATACLAGAVDAFFGRSRQRIRRFLTPGAFMRRKLIEGGMPAGRVFHVPNFVNASLIRPSHHVGDFMLFLGRLVPQKGVLTFLRAAELTPHIPCKVVGGGPLEQEIRGRVRDRRLHNVGVLGHREGEELWDLVERARAVVVPSEWYDPFPFVTLEGMAAARPVIVSRIAGPAEIVSDGRQGIHCTPGRADEFAAAFRMLWDNPQLGREMGSEGRKRIEAVCDVQLHYERVLRHYAEVMA